MYKLLAIDIDGTLISFKRPDISQRVRNAILKAKEKGTHIVLASGRNYKSMSRVLEHLDIREYGITSNGAVVVNLEDETILFEAFVAPHIAQGVTEIVEGADIAHMVFSGLHLYAHKRYEKNPTIQYFQKEEDNLRLYDNSQEFVNKVKINKYSVMGEDAILNKVIKKINERYREELEIVYGLKGHIDVYPKKVGKDIALQKLADKLEIPMNQVMAIGDSENDLAMIKAAGLGIAMGNAFVHVKKQADFVTKAIDEDGVAVAIERFII